MGAEGGLYGTAVVAEMLAGMGSGGCRSYQHIITANIVYEGIRGPPAPTAVGPLKQVVVEMIEAQILKKE